MSSCWKFGCCLLLCGASWATEYRSYDLEQVVRIQQEEPICRVNQDYLNFWLTDLQSRVLDADPDKMPLADRQRLSQDVASLETVVALAILESGQLELIRASALLASMAYRLGIDGADTRAELAFNRLLVLVPKDAAVLYRYGQFLLNARHLDRASLYLLRAFHLGLMEAEYPLALALIRSGKTTEGQDHLRHYQLTHPNSLVSWSLPADRVE